MPCTVSRAMSGARRRQVRPLSASNRARASSSMVRSMNSSFTGTAIGRPVRSIRWMAEPGG